MLLKRILSRGESRGEARASPLPFVRAKGVLLSPSPSFSLVFSLSRCLSLSPRVSSPRKWFPSRGELISRSLFPFAPFFSLPRSLSLFTLSRDRNNFRRERSSLSRSPFHCTCFLPSREKRREDREERGEIMFFAGFTGLTRALTGPILTGAV